MLIFPTCFLLAYDLKQLVDRLPWRIERALQHKCYSMLTGEDIEMFPDLVAANSNSRRGGGGGEDRQWKQEGNNFREGVSLCTCTV